MQELTHCAKCGLRFKTDRLDAAGHCKSCRKVAGEYEPKAKPERRPKVVERQSVWSTCGSCGMSGLESEEYCPVCFWDPEGEFGTEAFEDEDVYNHYDDSEDYNSTENIAARRQARTVTKRLGPVRWLVTAHLVLVGLAMVAEVALMVMESSADRFNFKFGQLALQMLLLADVRFELKSIHSTSRWGLRLAAGFLSVVALLLFHSPLGWFLGSLSVVYWRGVWVNRDLDLIRAAHPFAFLDGAWEEYNRKKIISELGKPGWWGTVPHRALLVTAPLLLLALTPIAFQYLRPGDVGPERIISRFQSAWNASDAVAVSAMSAPGRESVWVKRLERQNQARDWHGVLPSLDRVIEDPLQGDSIWVTYSGEDGDLRAEFAVFGKEWVLKSLDYRGFD